MIYLDNAATTKISEDVIDAVTSSMKTDYFNPSASYSAAIDCSKKIENCREIISKTINASKDEIYFTSCASEGNNLILRGTLKKGSHVITTPFEHSSIKKTIEYLEREGVDVTYLHLNSEGLVDLEELKKSIRKETVLVAIMHVNNEVGTIQNIKEIGSLIKETSSRAKFHVDAVQSYGKLNIDVKDMNIDSLTVSAHKINGPKGVGFSYITKDFNPIPLIIGGEQEKGLRAGTYNTPGIIGLTVASESKNKSIEKNFQYVSEIKSYFIKKFSDIERIVINSPIGQNCSPYILNVSFLGIRGEVLLNFLSGENIFVSTGSACTSKSKAGVVGSHVLEAVGLKNEQIISAIRFSFSPETTKEEIDKTYDTIVRGLKLFRRK